MNPIDVPKTSNPIVDALDTRIETIPRTGSYTNSLIGASMLVIGLALIYSLSLAALFWICLNILFSFFSPTPYFAFTGIFGFLIRVVLFTGCVSLFLSLIKPLFLKPGEAEGKLELKRDREPNLFAFVDRICVAVNAPAPHKILVDLDVNASASFESGVFDKRLQLSIGLPLIMGLNSRQLAGVVAHEFGHFTQTSGMRMTYFVRSLYDWFITAAFGQDYWDTKIAEWSENSQFPFLRWFFKLIFWMVIAGRRSLILLIKFGNLFITNLLRQMEFDADRYETRLCGSMNFARTSRMLQLLGLSRYKTFSDLVQYERTNRLPDNLPAILVDHANHIDPDEFRQFEEVMLNLKTGKNDTHPSDRERIESAARENTEGVYQVELPAHELFSDIQGLCRLCTKRLYFSMFGPKFRPEKLKDTNQLIVAADIERKESKAALRFALEQFASYDTFIFPRFQLGEAIDTNSYHAQTQQRRHQLASWVTHHTRVQLQEDELYSEMIDVTCARRLMEAGFDLSQARHLPYRTLQQVQQKSIEQRQREVDIKSRLTTFRQVMGQRLIDALEFLRAGEIVQSTDESAGVVEEVNLILQIWQRIIGLRGAFDTFIFEARVSQMFFSIAEHHLDEDVLNSIEQAVGRMHSSMAQFQSQTGDLRYPFEHGMGTVSVAHYLVPKLPPVTEIGEVMGAAVQLSENLEFLLKRCVSRLGALAEKVEKVFGFEPLEVPAEVQEIQRAALEAQRRAAAEEEE